MSDLNFYWRMGDYALQAVPKCLARFDKDDENETIELVKYYQYRGKECLYTIGYFYYDEHEPCWELKFVGDRFKELLETDVVAVFKMLKAAYDVLTEWKRRERGNNMTKREFLDIVFALAPNEANKIMDAFDEYVDSNEPHWIPVTERLPEVGESVLICDAYGDICIGHRTRSGYYFPDFCDDKIKDVRAWAELPEPFKGVTS